VAKALIEKTTIGQIARHIKEVYRPNMACIEILLDMDAINKLHLKVGQHRRRDRGRGGDDKTRGQTTRGEGAVDLLIDGFVEDTRTENRSLSL
jgi:hypothetical protein